MRRTTSRFLPLFILLTIVSSMPTRDTRNSDRDRDSEEDGILIDQALLRIFEAEDELASVVREIEQLQHNRDYTLDSREGSSWDTAKDQVLEDRGDFQDLGDQPLKDQMQGDQPMDDLPQGDMPMEGPVDDNEAQEIQASPTPPIFGGKANGSASAERFFQDFTSEGGGKRILQKEFIRTRVWNYTRPGNHSEDSSRGQRRKVDSQKVQDLMREFSNFHENSPENEPRPNGQQTLQNLLRTLNQNNGLSGSFTKSQSLFPSCEIPKNTDEEVWLPGENSFSLNLLFNFTQTKLAAAGWNVLEATLRLYKMAQHSTPLVSSCSLQNDNRNGSSPNAEISTTSESLPVTTEGLYTTGSSADKQVRVSVYLYTRALKKNRVKRRLLESRKISLNNNEWTAWNVLTAAEVYLQSRRNFGLVVEVEDENHCLLPAHRIFKGINCSEEAATARPVPFPIINAYEEHVSYTIGGTYTFNENFFPIMDIRSFESHPVINGPTSDVFSTAPSQSSDFELTEQAFDTQLNPHPRSSTSLAPLDAHRHRHGDITTSGNHRRRRKPNNVDDFRSLIIPQRVIMTAAEQRRQFSSTTPQPVTR